MGRKNDTRKLIIKKAKETFIERGFFNTTMSDIAIRVGLTRRTLYRYFENKEDLVYEITIEILKEWNDYQRRIYNRLEGSGIERLELFLNNLIDYMGKRIDLMKYLGEFDFYFKDDMINRTKADSISRFNKIIPESDRLLTKIIKLGQEDKSIKKELDVKLMVATISNVLWSFGQRIAIRGEAIKKEIGLDGIILIKNQVDIYIMAIKEA